MVIYTGITTIKFWSVDLLLSLLSSISGRPELPVSWQRGITVSYFSYNLFLFFDRRKIESLK